MIQTIAKLLYPDKCPFCGEVIPMERDVCGSCVLPYVPKFVDPKDNLSHRGYITKVMSVFYYTGVVQDSILRYKYYTKDSSFRQTGQIFAKYLKTIIEQNTNLSYDCITYVPMHESNKKEREYNQAEHLANCLGKLLKIPVKELLVKTRKTEMQHSLSAGRRAENVKGVIGFCGNLSLVNKRILLIDDIVTTGATVNECAKILKREKANRVDAATLATTKSTRG